MPVDHSGEGAVLGRGDSAEAIPEGLGVKDWAMKSRMVSQRAAKVESDSSGDRCCRKTYGPQPLSAERKVGAFCTPLHG